MEEVSLHAVKLAFPVMTPAIKFGIHYGIVLLVPAIHEEVVERVMMSLDRDVQLSLVQGRHVWRTSRIYNR